MGVKNKIPNIGRCKQRPYKNGVKNKIPNAMALRATPPQKTGYKIKSKCNGVACNAHEDIHENLDFLNKIYIYIIA